MKSFDKRRHDADTLALTRAQIARTAYRDKPTPENKEKAEKATADLAARGFALSPLEYIALAGVLGRPHADLRMPQDGLGRHGRYDATSDRFRLCSGLPLELDGAPRVGVMPPAIDHALVGRRASLGERHFRR